jgi:serine/threonine protein kinase
MFGVAGSPAYVAPEVLSGSYSEKVDIWGAGVLLHVLLHGSLPFQGGSLDAVFESIKTLELDFSSTPWESISVLGRDLIGRMLNRDVSCRMTADEVLSRFKLQRVSFSVVIIF